MTTARTLLSALLLGSLLSVVGVPSPAGAQTATPSPAPSSGLFDPQQVRIRTELVADGFASPVYVTGDGTGSGCLYIVERGGTVRILKDGRLLRDTLLDISDRVDVTGERGLHALAFHPAFGRNGRVFVHYNEAEGHTRIEEYRARPCRGGKGGQGRLVLAVEQPESNDNGGWIGFGPDGDLYVALGDGGGVSPGDPAGYSRRKDTLLAKILRLDVDRGTGYAVPRDNPFARKRRGFAPETWAWGLRNPWRASFDPLTGDLWLGDVGQDSSEEIDRIPAGESGLDFGWSDMEGDRCHNLAGCDPADYTPPVHVYDRAPPQCAVIGGYVYRGTAIPELAGAYLFSDFCSGVIWALDAEAVRQGGDGTAHVLLDAPQGWVSFGQDDAGELYVVALDGAVYRLEAEEAGG